MFTTGLKMIASFIMNGYHVYVDEIVSVFTKMMTMMMSMIAMKMTFLKCCQAFTHECF